MYDGQTVGVVVPAYNEAGSIGEVIEAMPGYVDRIYAVDDASSDGTWTEMREYAARQNARMAAQNGMAAQSGSGGTGLRPRVVTIRHKRSRGTGGAVKTGYARAFEDEIDVIAVIGGDGRIEPANLERVIEPVAAGQVTYAKGNRFHPNRDNTTVSRWRLFGNRLLEGVMRASSGYWELSDPQSEFTAISSRGLRAVDFDGLSDDYGFQNDLLVALNINREPVADVAHPARDGDERSTIRYSTFVPRLSALIARNFLTRIVRSYVFRRFHPLSACYGFGAVVLLVGVAGGGYSLLNAGVDTFVGGMASLSVATLGLVLVLFGTWLDVLENEGMVHDISAPSIDESAHVEAVRRERQFDVAHDGGTPDSGTEADRQ